MYVVGMNALKCRERDKNAGVFTKPGQIIWPYFVYRCASSLEFPLSEQLFSFYSYYQGFIISLCGVCGTALPQIKLIEK